MDIKQTPASIEYQKEVTDSMFGLMSMVKKHQDMIDNYVSDSLNTQLEDLPGEIWKDITGFDGQYQISNKGRVKSLKRWSHNGQHWFYRDIILKPKLCNNNYFVQLKHLNNTVFKSIAQLVATEFIPNPNNYTHIIHIDNNPKNNHVENLQWASYQDKYNYGYTPFKIAISSGNPVSQFDRDGNYITSYINSVEAAKAVHTTDSCIILAIHEKSNSAGGYLWEPYSPEHIPGYKLPEEKIKHIKDLIPVSKFDKDGKWLANYDSILQASKLNNINAATIYNCIYRPDIAYSAGGYIWKRTEPIYKEGYHLPSNEIPIVGLNNKDKAKHVNIYGLQTNELIKSCNSIQEASTFLNKSRSEIRKYLKRDGIYKNYKLELVSSM